MELDSFIFLNVFKDLKFLNEVGFIENNVLGMYILNIYEVYWNILVINFRDRMLKEYNVFWMVECNIKVKVLGLFCD